MNPYRVLKIRKDSRDKRIKKAFRDRVKQCHPDVGGNEKEFIEIRGAYAVLIDKDRRALYDRTGEIDETTALWFESQIVSAIASLFNAFLTSGEAFKKDVDIIKSMIEKADKTCRQMEEGSGKQEGIIKALKELRRRINNKRAGGGDIFNTLIDYRIKEAEETKERVDKNTKVLSRVVKELEGYTCIVELVQTVQVWNYATVSNTGTGTGTI